MDTVVFLNSNAQISDLHFAPILIKCLLADSYTFFSRFFSS